MHIPWSDLFFPERAWLPPSLRLQPVREPAGSVLEGDPAHQTSESVRPTGVRQKRPQHGTAEKLAASSDLRCDRELAEPAIELAIAGLCRNKTLGVVEPSLKGERNIFCEEDLRSHTKRSPIVEAVSGLAVPLPLKDENRHDRKLVIGLNEEVFRDEQSLRALEERIRVINGRAEIAGRALAILDGKCVIAAKPFQTLETESEGVAIGSGNDQAGLGRTALRVRIVEPQAKAPKGSSYVVETNVNVVFGVIPILRNDVGSSACQECDRQLANSHIEILNTSSIATYVQRVEVVNLNMLSAVISLSSPELRIGLALQNVAGTHEGFPQSELVISSVTRKICIAGGIRRVGFNHDFCF